MTPKERAKALVGDMPWVTEHLTADQLVDLPKQVEACIQAHLDEFKLMTYCAYCGHKEPIDGDGSLISKHIATCEKHPIAVILAENKRLRWRLNHQTDDDVEACRQGNHPFDCGK